MRLPRAIRARAAGGGPAAAARPALRAPALAAVLASVAVAGCGPKPKPPAFALYPYAKLAILPLAHGPREADLAADLRALLARELANLGAVPLAPLDAVAAADWSTPAARQASAASLGCDLLLVGSVTRYETAQEVGTPERVRVETEMRTYRWGFAETVTARFAASVALVDARTGKTVWRRDAPGEGRQSRWLDVDWPGETSAAPADGWAALQRRARDAAGNAATPLEPLARAGALERSAEIVLADFLGRDGWSPPARAAAAAR